MTAHRKKLVSSIARMRLLYVQIGYLVFFFIKVYEKELEESEKILLCTNIFIEKEFLYLRTCALSQTRITFFLEIRLKRVS